MDNIRLYPDWKNAVEKAAKEFKYGDLISMEWLHRNFNIERPQTGTYEAFRNYSFEFLAAIEGFKNDLLEKHQMALMNVRGDGYMVLQPKEQTRYAEKKLYSNIHKEIRKATNIMNNINYYILDDEQQRANADAKARLAALVAIASQQRRRALMYRK